MSAWGGLHKIVLLVWLTLCGSALEAKDLGEYGSVYNILEQDALDWIMQRLNQLQTSGELDRQKTQMQEKVKQKVLRPPPVKGLKRTTQPRTFIHDISVVVDNDIVDAKGKVIHRKGTRVNPLDFIHSSKAMLFLDGDDPEQLQWALNEHAHRGDLVKLVLINGPVMELMERTQVRFYFDQEGKLVKRFRIEQIPAIVEQKGNQLQVAEVKI